MSDLSINSNDHCVVAHRLTGDYVPDANLSKSVWHNTSRISLVDTQQPDRSHPDIATEVSTCWSLEHLYVAFWCRYSELNLYAGEDPQLERWELWNRDVAEVFVNPHRENPHRYWEFEVAPNNQWVDLEVETHETTNIDASWGSGFAHAASINEASKIWTCELRIPAMSLGVAQIQRGMEWRINFYRCDGFGDNSQRRFLAWSPTFKLNFHVPQRFGWVQMGD